MNVRCSKALLFCSFSERIRSNVKWPRIASYCRQSWKALPSFHPMPYLPLLMGLGKSSSRRLQKTLTANNASSCHQTDKVASYCLRQKARTCIHKKKNPRRARIRMDVCICPPTLIFYKLGDYLILCSEVKFHSPNRHYCPI